MKLCGESGGSVGKSEGAVEGVVGTAVWSWGASQVGVSNWAAEQL